MATLPSEQIIVQEAITSTLFHVKEAMTEYVLLTLMSHHKEVVNRLSAALQFLIERVFKKLLRTPQTTAEVTKAVINKPAFIHSNATLIKWE